MDSGVWIHGCYDINNNTSGGGNNGFMCGYAAASSCTPAEMQYREEEEQQQFLISSQIQHHLNQISMCMNMDDEASVYDVPSSNDGGAVVSPIGIVHSPIIVDGSLLDPPHHHAGRRFPSSSSSSSLSLPSASLSCSPESSSAHVLAAPAAATTAACSSQYLEVSSQVPLPPPAVPYCGDHQYANLNVPAPELPPATNAGGGAFRRYARHLGPKRPPKLGACGGQRMFKTAIAVLSRMHAAARYNQQYYYQQAAAAATEAVPPPSVNQMQHMFSERKRREKLNDSFHALKTVLPPGAKKDKTSILIRAREYVRSLESKVSELEEKNRSLESRLLRGEGSGRKDAAAGGGNDEKVQVEIARTAKAERAGSEPCADDLCTLKIVVMRSPCNMTDVMLRTLQCLREQIGDGVSLVAMSTSDDDSTTGVNNTCPPPVLTLQIKSPSGARWEEQPVKDAVAKVVADALTTTAMSSSVAAR